MPGRRFIDPYSSSKRKSRKKITLKDMWIQRLYDQVDAMFAPVTEFTFLANKYGKKGDKFEETTTDHHDDVDVKPSNGEN